MKTPDQQLLAQCPLCQATYQKDAVRLLGERGATRLFHCSCQQCGHAVMAILLESSGWVSSVGVVTDLTAQDALRFRTSEPISADECIRFHQQLFTP